MAGNSSKKIRVLLAKIGLDGHDRGAYIVSQILREVGMEVIFLGRYQSAEMVVRAAVHEDVSVIAISDHCGVMVDIIADVINEAKRLSAENIAIVVGGLIAEEDIPVLKRMGVTGCFVAGSSHEEIVNHIREVALKRMESN